MNEEDRKIAIELLLEKSQRNIDQARFCADSGYWDLIVNRLYYGLFHAVTAMMMVDGIKAKTHKGTSGQFGFYYVITGKFSREDGVFYNKMQLKREQADYDNVFKLSSEEGKILMERAISLHSRMLEYVRSKRMLK